MKSIRLRHTVQKGDFTLDVDTEIPAHGITGILGESGSGKTTLLRCIAGLEESAKIGQPVYKRQVGFVFQQPQLFAHLSVRKNIDYGLRRNPDANVSIEEVAGMLDVASLLDRSTTGLSGGEAQRVAIARVLCQAPRLILMDEPLSALDERRRHEVLPYLDDLHAKSSIPIIYVSHNINEICRLSDHLLVLDEGRIVAEGDLQATLLQTALPQFAGANAGAVVEAIRSRYDAEFDLTVFDFSGGEIWAPGRHESQSARLRISASDISLSRSRAESSTILNILPVTIEATDVETDATALVRLKAGQDYLVARITRRSLQGLDLRAGDSVYAQIKSVTVRP